ncbi:MAG: hypothetical protein FD135_4124 [Comamonadaceae bacterium]|nr:MAG: hypothetical protein FD135_4124 [Comamonadaceae bacterium]
MGASQGICRFPIKNGLGDVNSQFLPITGKKMVRNLKPPSAQLWHKTSVHKGGDRRLTQPYI